MLTEGLAVVGRDAELATLLQQWGEAAASPRTVLLAADAGGGKTTVIGELVRRLTAPGATSPTPQVVVGECVPLGELGLALVPVAQLLRRLIEAHGVEQVLEWAGAGADTLGAVLPALGRARPADEDRLRLFEAITRVLEQAAARQPLLVVVEDAHWADESTRQLLRFVTQSLRPAHVMVLISYRTDEVHRRHPLRPFLAELVRLPQVLRVELPLLTVAEVAQLLEQRLGHPVGPDLAASVHERSEGVPYFVAELGQALERGCPEMPDNLRDALLVRAATVSEEAQALVRLMTTAGNSISHALLREVSDLPEPELDRLLREAVDSGLLLTTESGYRFRHALLREVLHADLLPGEHSRSHARFAEVLTVRPDLARGHLDAEIAHHWSAAHEPQRAFDAAMAAAASASSPYEQLRMLEVALELWDRVDHGGHGSHADVLERAAGLARRLGDSRRGLPLIRASLAETDEAAEPLVSARRQVVKGILLGLSTDDLGQSYADAIATTTAAVELTRPHGDTHERAQALDALATQLMLTGDREHALEVAREAERTAVAIGADHLRASALNTQGSVLVGLGEEAEGLATLRRSLPLADGSEWLQLRYHVNMSDALLSAGRAEESIAVATEGIEVARRQGISRAAGAMLIGNAVAAMLELDRWDEAGELLRTGRELSAIGHHALHLQLVGAWMDTWQGRSAQARAVLDLPGAGRSPAGRLPQFLRLLCITRADLAWLEGDPAGAWQELQPLLDRPQLMKEDERWRLLTLAARSAAAVDDPAAATARVHELAASCREVTAASWARPLVAAELADTAAAWRAAVAALGHGPAHLRPYAGLRLASTLLVGRQRGEAEAVLAAACEQARRLGLVPLHERLRRLQRRSGERDGTGVLTPREAEVLRLVAEGRSNAEIGRELFISAKTSSVHVSNILAKLDASSRGEAAAKARRAGLLD
ncbi:helix-turn-helix transcriptional regulator [Auraticoccus cholistanensis]|uniref:helix-turn-helix transcriptional regulator n=1 Tax=Auraticoccus cholistanensis TaxID=2656650 RepID=UPI0018D21544